jgi:N-acetyltransferase 10
MVNRDALFSFQPLSEGLLQRVWGLYTAAHYKSSPNDLQMLSDAPAHRLLLLLGPARGAKDALPDVLCVLQVTYPNLHTG